MKCVICDKKAIKRFSPDMDIQGIGACKKHVDDVSLAYVMLLQGDEKMYLSYIKGLKKKVSPRPVI